MKTRDLIDHKYTAQVTQEIIKSFRRAFATIRKLDQQDLTEDVVIDIMRAEYDQSAVANSDNLYNMSRSQYDASVRKMQAMIRASVAAGYKYQFDKIDRDMLNVLDQNNTLFIGKYFDNQLEPLIRKEMSKIITEQQSKAATVDAIAQMLKDTAGGYAYNYSKMIVETNGTWARSISSTNILEDIDIIEYQYLVYDDAVTSDICLALKGRTNTVEAAIKTRDNYLAMPTGSYDEAISHLERVSPFIRATDDGWEAGGRQYSKDDLMNIPGISLPPFHPNCRTEIIITNR